MYDTIDSIRTAAAEGDAPFWFSPSSMAFFDTTVEEEVGVIGGRYFVTSEVDPSGVKRWSVRECTATGSIDTVAAGFHAYDTLAEAVAAAEAL